MFDIILHSPTYYIEQEKIRASSGLYRILCHGGCFQPLRLRQAFWYLNSFGYAHINTTDEEQTVCQRCILFSRANPIYSSFFILVVNVINCSLAYICILIRWSIILHRVFFIVLDLKIKFAFLISYLQNMTQNTKQNMRRSLYKLRSIFRDLPRSMFCM